MKSLPVPPKVSGNVLAGDDEVVARAADDQVEAVAALDNVVAVVALQDIVAADIRNDVVAGAAFDVVVAVAALEPVVAAVAPQRVVADAADEDVVAAGIERVAGVGAAEDDVVAARVLEVVGICPLGRWIVADDKRIERVESGGVLMDRVVPPVEPEARELLALVHLQDEGGCGEHVGRQVRGVRVRHDHLGERVVLELGQEVETGETRQVVEPVAVLQGLELGLEHEVEGGAEEAAERHDPLGEAADPEVDVVDAGGGQAIDIGVDAGAVEEGRAVGIVGDEGPLLQGALVDDGAAAEHQRRGHRALLGQRVHVGRREPGMRAVGGDEIDERLGVLDALHEVDPALVGRELAVAGAARGTRAARR